MADLYQIIADSALMTATPDDAAESVSEILFGEQVQILSESHGDEGEYVQIKSKTDGYEGYVFHGILDDEPTEATHKISVVRTFALCEPDFKSPPLRCLSFFSPLSVVMDDNGFGLLEQGGWVYTDHIKDIADTSAEPLESALKFLETPYLWGGRSSLGLDCSALVQLALMDGGHQCPRDTKEQIDSIGEAVDEASIQKGDIVFFEGHVGMMVDDTNILNATARHMKVLIEPLEDVAKAYNGILAIKRLG